MSIAIKIENLSKRYRLGVINRDMLYKDLQSRWANFRGKEDPNARIASKHDNRLEHRDEFWALRNVDLEVQDGEILGVIGRNGAGKSTLLKILSQITAPTEGQIKIKGRIASLLEVGTGFHPELTGRENVYLNGAILGMSRREVGRKFDQIVAFSEVEEFIDTPVKRYSSGMRVKLAFAVASHLDADILVVDEVLAVGDAAFQHKCIEKMNLLRQAGRTILFVSHNTGTLATLCSVGIVLKDGRIHGAKTEIGKAIQFYLSEFGSFTQTPIASRIDRQGRGDIRLQDIRLYSDGKPIQNSVRSGEDLTIEFKCQSAQTRVINDLDFRIFLHHNERGFIGKLCSSLSAKLYSTADKSAEISCYIPKLPLIEGVYFLECSIREKGIVQDLVHNALKIEVINGDFYRTGRPVSSGSGFLIEHSWS